MLHRVGRQLRQHQHQLVGVLVTGGGGKLIEEEAAGLADGRRGGREPARDGDRLRVDGVHGGRGLSLRRIGAFHTGCPSSALALQPLNHQGDGAMRHPPSAATIRPLPCTFVEERYESELTRAAAVLDDVDRALERLSDGTYGQCETCGAPVLEADLERDPTRSKCEQHLTLA